MPTYEYKCDACGKTFEKFQSITSVPIKKCPNCGKSKVRRLIGTGAGMIFKGSGFYITDYRDSSYKDKAKAESSAASGSAETSAANASGGNSNAGDSRTGQNQSPDKGGASGSVTPEANSSGKGRDTAQPAPSPPAVKAPAPKPETARSDSSKSRGQPPAKSSPKKGKA